MNSLIMPALGAAVVAPPTPELRKLALWWQRTQTTRRKAMQARRQRHTAPSSSALASLIGNDWHRQL